MHTHTPPQKKTHTHTHTIIPQNTHTPHPLHIPTQPQRQQQLSQQEYIQTLSDTYIHLTLSPPHPSPLHTLQQPQRQQQLAQQEYVQTLSDTQTAIASAFETYEAHARRQPTPQVCIGDRGFLMRMVEFVKYVQRNCG